MAVGVGDGVWVGDVVGVGDGVGDGVLVGSGDQFAVAVLGLFITMSFDGEEFPEASPLQPAKMYCVPEGLEIVVGLIVAYAELPALYQPSPLVTP